MIWPFPTTRPVTNSSAITATNSRTLRWPVFAALIFAVAVLQLPAAARAADAVPPAAPAPAPIQDADGLQAGVDYILLPAGLWQRNGTGRVQVLEFFSWGCPHCYAFHGTLNAWAAKLPQGVTLDRVPVSFGHAEWQPLLRTFYALKNLGKLQQFDNGIFEAIHDGVLNTSSIDNIAAWLGPRGLDAQQFLTESATASVANQIENAREMTTAFGVESVPQMVVGGRYVVTGQGAKDYGDVLRVTDKLIARLRKP